MYSYFYYIDGLVIDTGHSHMREYAMDFIAELPVEQIFITHHHEDHNGNLNAFQAQFNCPAYASAECVEIMKNPPGISFAEWLTWGKTEANSKLQVEEKHISTSKYEFDLIFTPGHAPDMYCLHEPKEGWLFSADLWVKEYIRIFMRSESMGEQITSLRKVLELDFDTILCSHNPQLSGGKPLVQQKLEFFENFYGKVAHLYQQGNSPRAIFKEMRLKEDRLIRLLSGGNLSTMNMVKSVIRDEERLLPTAHQ